MSSPPYILSAAASLLLVLAAASAAANETAPNPNTRRRSFRREFLDAHNEIRSSFQVPPLKWDRNLTRFARRWGEKLAGDCKMIHSYGPYGENLFWGKLERWTASEAVKSWGGENRFYDLDSNVCAAGQLCGHFTQIVWKDSLRLGCARINCVNGEMIVICEYDPPGNFINEKPF